MIADYPGLQQQIPSDVAAALAEDVGSGDITAQLVPAEHAYKVNVITREPAIICGLDWVRETFAQLNGDVALEFHCEDGSELAADSTVFTASGNARAILTAERTALNFLQMLSGIATESARYAKVLANHSTSILDTRKTIPGFRLAQKYAVRCGGCDNHRFGLYDAFLIKENHIAACGGIEQSIAAAKAIAPDKPIEIEVENLAEFARALEAGAHIIMLDDMSLDAMQTAVQQAAGRCKLEASGNMTLDRLPEVAATGVDFISIGSLTKHIRAIDLSMRFI